MAVSLLFSHQVLNFIHQSTKPINPSCLSTRTAELNIGIICACLPSFAPLKNRHIFGNLVPASFQSFLRKSFDSFSRGSSKASSRRAGEDQGSDINVELVDAGKASTRIYSSGEPWVSAEGNILRETVMSVDYSKGLDVEGRI